MARVLQVVLDHPIATALVMEAVQVATFCAFPVGACNQPLPGVAVVILHYPVLLLLEHVLGMAYGLGEFAVAAAVMAVLWAGVLYGAREVLVAIEERTRRQPGPTSPPD